MIGLDFCTEILLRTEKDLLQMSNSRYEKLTFDGLRPENLVMRNIGKLTLRQTKMGKWGTKYTKCNVQNVSGTNEM